MRICFANLASVKPPDTKNDWSKVPLYPAPSISSWDGADTVVSEDISALAPTIDNSLKEDRLLFQVRALGYYEVKSKENKELVFFCFKILISKFLL